MVRVLPFNYQRRRRRGTSEEQGAHPCSSRGPCVCYCVLLLVGVGVWVLVGVLCVLLLSQLICQEPVHFSPSLLGSGFFLDCTPVDASTCWVRVGECMSLCIGVYVCV